MVPDPLHPAIVHFPVVFSILAPIAALVALFAIRRGANARKAWSVAVAFLGALSLSAWVAVETGEQQEERVEDVVAERPFETHEEAAKSFLLASGAVLVLAAAGLATGTVGRMGRIAGAAGSLALLGMGAYVGKSGGELVYKYGAASAYATPSGGGERSEAREGEQRREMVSAGEAGLPADANVVDSTKTGNDDDDR